MKKTVYLESSVISYLTSRISRDVIIAGRQAITQEWWDNQRPRFNLSVSALVIEEISRGETEAAKSRLDAIEDIPCFSVSDEAVQIAELLIEHKAIPKGCEADALHIGIAAANGADYLLTWNFKHINNAETKSAIEEIIESAGYQCPLLCSPEELGGSFDA